jgi:4-amino-4-deoxy-L-arabinose transferase-like glycosyltransferase
MKRTLIYWLWTVAVLALVAMHAVHPRADFPNHSPWMDYSKYTDEGWYGKAAIDHYAVGTWYLPGDFNPAIALPVLPALEFVVFHFTGPSLAAARLLVLSIFAADLLLVYVVLRTQASRWVELLAVTPLAANAFLYAFSRLAILESLLIFFLLVSWVIATRLPQRPMPRYAAALGVGLAMCLMILTKTTAIFLLPSTLFLLWSNAGPGIAIRIKTVAAAAFAAAIPWSAYYFLWVRPRYITDYRYIFIANQWTHPANLFEWSAALWYTVHGTLWISPALVLLFLALSACSLLFFRGLWRNPLLIASLLAIAGYFLFIAWHNNMQPRYYQVIAYPLVIVIALAAEHLITAAQRDAKLSSRFFPFFRTATMAGLALLLALSTIGNLRQIAHWTCHPEYTWINAANALTRYIDLHPDGNRLLLSISGDQITLTTGLPAICDDFGPWDLPVRAAHYQPGWYAAWNELDPGTQSDLETLYKLEPVASFSAFDDPDRNLLILYKLHPLPPEKLETQK